jgi:hypothetical protein
VPVAGRSRAYAIKPLAPPRQRRALALADPDVVLILFELVSIDYRADVGSMLARIVDGESLDAVSECVKKLAVDAGGDDQPR